MIHRPVLFVLVLVVVVVVRGGGSPPLLPLPHLVGGSVEAKLGGEVFQALNPRTRPFAQPPDQFMRTSNYSEAKLTGTQIK